MLLYGFPALLLGNDHESQATLPPHDPPSDWVHLNPADTVLFENFENASSSCTFDVILTVLFRVCCLEARGAPPPGPAVPASSPAHSMMRTRLWYKIASGIVRDSCKENRRGREGKEGQGTGGEERCQARGL